LHHASHPKACIFTFLFKALAIISYFLFSETIWAFILVIIFSAFDFWTVKNVTGRYFIIIIKIIGWFEMGEYYIGRWYIKMGILLLTKQINQHCG
jgi:hypothetical protein